MAPLTDRLRRMIADSGPVPVSTFMAEALGHKQFGYYRTRDPLGASGDFTTAPEISQVFGELIGLWAVIVWRSMGAPDKVRVVELGPGRGTLMADLLRAARRADPDFAAAAEIHLVETSAPLRTAQSARLADVKPRWHDDLSSVPSGPLLLIANEFFDALPIRQLVWQGEHWSERLVANSPDGFVFTTPTTPSPLAAAVPTGLGLPEEGAVFEFCPTAHTIAQSIGARLAGDGGAALIIDYGHAGPGYGETLQAVSGHVFADPLTAPGEADLTAHVDFTSLSGTLRGAGAAVRGTTTQGEFLRALGIEARRDRLLAAARADQAADVGSGIARLIAPDQMGTMFKVLCATSPQLPAPPGFDT